MGSLSNPKAAVFLARYFKTGPGEYGEGDHFRGIRVPVLRKLAKEYAGLPLSESEELLHSSFHEDRLLALLILERSYAGSNDQKQIYELYLRNTNFINGWDLVDTSAPNIVGAFLSDKDRRPIFKLARSRSLWERRIAIMATFYFIRRGEFKDTLKIAYILLSDPEDLIQKAVGWMLREVGKRNREVQEDFLRAHYRLMSRVTLRYAIEKFPEKLRRAYLKGLV